MFSSYERKNALTRAEIEAKNAKAKPIFFVKDKDGNDIYRVKTIEQAILLKAQQELIYLCSGVTIEKYLPQAN